MSDRAPPASAPYASRLCVRCMGGREGSRVEVMVWAIVCVHVCGGAVRGD